ncbi:MAG TPA: glutamine--scyllo-inositol aminotransferase [Phycisphaerales bacterium]|nr:glutamine--scyllo-inositol aminotransferase [Phycisphaerales bacterium]
MTTQNATKIEGKQNLTRRQFLSTSCMTLSGTAVGLGTQRLLGREGTTAPPIPNINPGYIGPQFFDEREEQALLEVLESGSPFRYWGPGKPTKVLHFEEKFAEHMGTHFALGVTSGTAALDCAVAGLGIGPGDEVIIPAYTWWSDYTCVVNAGALPVFADIDRTLNIDPRDFERKITPRTKAVIAVHLLGGLCDMDPIMGIARKKGVAVLEDCAQCVGGSYRGKKLGSIGDVGIYSFQINKLMTSGEGGAVVTSDPLIYERAARFHDMGTIRRVFTDRSGPSRVQTFAGENFRMSELTGAVLGAQLTKLDLMLTQLRGNAGSIYDGIKDLAGIRLRHRPDPDGDIGYGVYFEMKDKTMRDRCIRELRKRKVPASTLSGSVLLPIHESVINKRTRHPDWPSFNSTEGKKIKYGPDSCRQTLGIFDRFVQIRIGPKYTERINNYIVDTIRRVHQDLV